MILLTTEPLLSSIAAMSQTPRCQKQLKTEAITYFKVKVIK
jgi:hypothetical protein